MDHVRWTNEPQLRSPVLICAFAGWNDAGEASTLAVRHLAETWGARQFGAIDAEEFFDFSTIRPQVRLANGRTREVLWPHTELLAASIPGAAHDAVIIVGIEPQLRWRTYTEQVIAVAERLDVELVVTLGALLADVPHTREVAIIGTAADQELIEQFGLQRSRYEGPTGIIGVLHDACTKAAQRTVSLWAAVPGYAQQHASPKAALALVERAASILRVQVPVGSLRETAVDYEREVSEAVAADDDLTEYVRRLEEMADAADGERLTFDPSGTDDNDNDNDNDNDEKGLSLGDGSPRSAHPAHGDAAPPPLSPEAGDALVAEVEQFLREQPGRG